MLTGHPAAWHTLELRVYRNEGLRATYKLLFRRSPLRVTACRRRWQGGAPCEPEQEVTWPRKGRAPRSA